MALTDPLLEGAGVPPAGDAALGRIARSGLWSILAHACSAGSLMVVSIVIGRSLGPPQLGRYTFHIWILRVVPIVIALGVPTALTRFVSEKEGRSELPVAAGLFRLVRRFHLALLALPLAAVAALAVAGRLSAGLAAVLVAGIAVGLFTLDYEALLTGLRRFRDLGVVAAVVGASQIAAAIVALALDVDWQGFLALYVAAAAVGVLVMAVVGHRWLGDVNAAAPVPRDERRRFSRFAWAVALAVTAEAFLWGRPELLFLERYRPAADLGLYSTALRLATLASMIPLVAARSLLPEFSYQQASGRHEEMRATFRSVCSLLLAVSAPLALGGAAVAWALVTVVFGPEFEAAGTATAILLAGSLVNALAGPSAAVVLIGPRPRLVAEVGVAAIVLNAALDVALIPSMGPVGAALANVVVQSLCVLVGIGYAWVRLGLRYPVTSALRVLAFAGASALVARSVLKVDDGAGGLAAAIAAGAVVYLVLLVASGTFEVGDLRRALTGGKGPSTRELDPR